MAERASEPEDEVARSLENLARAVEANARDERLLARRIRQMASRREAGRPWRDVVAGEAPPGVLTLTSQVLGRLTDASGRVRRSLARALRAEGETIPGIARHFGVTHQRVSNLLRRG